MRKRPAILLSLLAFLASALSTPDNVAGQSDEAYYDLGGFHYRATTDSDDAQLWFDRGLAMCYGFNHEEAVRCFKRAIAMDPSMAMAYWGMAYAWGPNFNNMEIDSYQISKAELAIELAALHANDCTPLERELIDALATRYATPVPEDRDPLNLAYAKAMRELHKRHADDPLVVTLFAESLMILQPWKHFNQNGEPGTHTPEIIDVLEAGLKRWPAYPSLCHLYIHTMESSPTPEKALPAADQLRAAMPGQGHIVHMPSHIDIWLGDYARVVEENQQAIDADKEFLRRDYQHHPLPVLLVYYLVFLPAEAPFSVWYHDYLALLTGLANTTPTPIPESSSLLSLPIRTTLGLRQN